MTFSVTAFCSGAVEHGGGTGPDVPALALSVVGVVDREEPRGAGCRRNTTEGSNVIWDDFGVARVPVQTSLSTRVRDAPPE